MLNINGQLYSSILMNFVEIMTTIKKFGGLKTKSLAKLVTTFPEEPFMKWGLDL